MDCAQASHCVELFFIDCDEVHPLARVKAQKGSAFRVIEYDKMQIVLLAVLRVSDELAARARWLQGVVIPHPEPAVIGLHGCVTNQLSG